jgi:hypothetical protein
MLFCRLRNLDESQELIQFYGLNIALYVNLIFLNSFYVVFALLGSVVWNVALCESVGVLLHYFLVSSFGLILSMAILRFVQIYTAVGDSSKFSQIAFVAVNGKLTGSFVQRILRYPSGSLSIYCT